MKFKYVKSTAAALALILSNIANAGIIMHSEDYIDDTSRAHFNGFESMPMNSGELFTGGNGPYVEDLIQVEQINGDSGANDGIWAKHNWVGAQGDNSWYPNIGDYGYTSITLSDSSDFGSIGFNFGTGGRSTTEILFEVYNDGVLILKGSSALLSDSINYLGFSGDSFDEVRVKDNFGGSNFYSGRQTLAIDNIEIAGNLADVPEPSSLAIFALGVIGLLSRRAIKQ
ncbi:PEP-CTERM sorting domain-containing protein [Thalassomonas haliotis]|uniref:PEP-CTERM sorting domain-containing protein n=1 Tax=Thalassomonas haliotis TaxID=485448 RepID=A0ABY7VK74_9GAMM|nr:PEP-CTERM sorting domain-containing protein [Thalassomonas haliotis]WDE13062.1 PEP-CTERM sorting domain-containing protein [Thalassomonas haliotis]